MSGSGRFRLSSRIIAAIVVLSAIAAMLIAGTLLAVLVLRPGTGTASESIAEAPSLEIPDPVASSSPSPIPPATHGPGLWSGQNVKSTPSALLAKPIVAGIAFTQPKWTATPIPTQTPTPSPTPNPTFVSSAYGLGGYMPDGIAPNERWIDVNVTEQKLVAYEGLVPVFESLVSTGTSRYPTVTGQFRIWLRFQSQDMDGYRLGYDYYLRNVPYVQYFYEDYALHGTFWHSNFGTPMSHGCVNLSPGDAEWLFNWAGYGTLVNVHP